ncbi:MAG: terminase gpP N-terminus-related DNA-binding protein [Eggerthellaceae bacterium]
MRYGASPCCHSTLTPRPGCLSGRVLKYALADQVAFNDDEHCKAWLIRVTATYARTCSRPHPSRGVARRRGLRSPTTRPRSPHRSPARWWAPCVPLTIPSHSLVSFSVRGYTAPEIAQMVDAPVNTVYSWLARGKQLQGAVMTDLDTRCAGFDNVTVPDDVKRGTLTYSKLCGGVWRFGETAPQRCRTAQARPRAHHSSASCRCGARRVSRTGFRGIRRLRVRAAHYL